MSRSGLRICVLLLLLGVAAATAGAGAVASPPEEPEIVESDGATASAEVESLVRYLPGRRLPVRMKCPEDSAAPGRFLCLRYYGTCSAECRVTFRNVLVLPRRIVRFTPFRGTFEENEVFRVHLVLRPRQIRALRRNRSKARLKTLMRAVDVETEDTDTDRRVFRFKRKPRKR